MTKIGELQTVPEY